MSEKLYSTEEVAKILGLSIGGVYRKFNRKGIKRVKKGRKAFITASTLEELTSEAEPLNVDCAFAGKINCRALNVRCIDPAICPFRKTEAELEKSREKADMRLRKLPPEQQECIAKTYYGNKRAWNK